MKRLVQFARCPTIERLDFIEAALCAVVSIVLQVLQFSTVAPHPGRHSAESPAHHEAATGGVMVNGGPRQDRFAVVSTFA